MSDTPGPPSTPGSSSASGPSSTTPPPPPPAPNVQDEPDQPDKPWWQRWWAITAFVVLVLVLIVVFVGGGDDPDVAPSPTPTAAASASPSASAAATGSEPAPTDQPSTPSETSTTAAPTEAATTEQPATDDPSGEPGSRDNPFAIGDGGSLPEWDVTVDELALDATQQVLDANDFNEEPENGNYALVTLTATYTGEDEGDAGFLLGTTLVGADSRQYSDTDCFAVEPDPMIEQPTVENGGTVTGQFCLDYPDEALGDGAILFVEEFLSFDEDRLYWAVPTS